MKCAQMKGTFFVQQEGMKKTGMRDEKRGSCNIRALGEMSLLSSEKKFWSVLHVRISETYQAERYEMSLI